MERKLEKGELRTQPARAHDGMKWLTLVSAVTTGMLLGAFVKGNASHYDLARILASEDKTVNKSSSRTYPLFIDSGQGTTATHALHEALCDLNVPSAHFMRACYQTSNERNAIDEEVEKSVNDHWEVMNAWDKLRNCKNNPGCSFSEGIRLDEEVRDRIETVIRGGIGGVNDSPYPLYLSHVLKVSETLSAGSTVLMMSERDPHEWAASRVKNHPDVFFCKNPLATLDFPLCIKLAMMEDPQPENFGDIFMWHDQFPGEKSEEFLRIVAEGMNSYQEGVLRQSPGIRFHLFEERMSTKDIADKILERAKSSISPTFLWPLSRPTTKTCIRKWDGTKCGSNR
mmetsp:Transcript_51767/g.155351  ORF Transcript_51767/g.155351 Transcript_51767/m.155351 type:complete len:341 (-) Transcript_51767:954-1976(-)